jgi:hypothetical protein
MTNNYAQMTDEQLRLAIVKAKGYGLYQIGQTGYVAMSSGMSPKLEKHRVDEFVNPQHIQIFTPDWPVDISAAWELWEEIPVVALLKNHDISEIQVYDEGEAVRDNIAVVRYRISGKFSPRAICIAYLAWKDATK